MLRNITAVSTLVLVASLATAEAGPSTRRPGGPPPGRILNQVIDLLDTEVVFQSATEAATWESPIFDTSQYNDLVLRVSVEAESGSVGCNVVWRFSEDQEFLVSGVDIDVNQLPGDPGTFGRFFIPSSNPVQGLQAI